MLFFIVLNNFVEPIEHEASVGFAARGMILHINDEDILRKFTEGGAAITNGGLIF